MHATSITECERVGTQICNPHAHPCVSSLSLYLSLYLHESHPALFSEMENEYKITRKADAEDG